jgi:hypothetical protein
VAAAGAGSGRPTERLGGGGGLERCGPVRIGRKAVGWLKSVKAFGDLSYRVPLQHFTSFQSIFFQDALFRDFGGYHC